MHPAYFALVMATGIVAIAAYRLGLNELAFMLSWINIVIFPNLWILFFLRIFLFPQNVIEDLKSHVRAPGYFTAVAATGVLGVQTILLHNNATLAEGLWWMTLGLWVLCIYPIFAILTVKTEKPASLSDGINGGWLVAVVATQSVPVLGCNLGASQLGDQNITLFVLLSFWLFGGVLYLWIITLIFYRYMFFPLSPKDLMPPYWINMGAVAISTLAGALLVTMPKNSALLDHLHPFILGFTVLFWAAATWWIPMLFILGIWRYRIRRVSLSYDPLYWGLVFPFGMYSVCTLQLAQALNAPFLLWISRASVIAAASAWLMTFLGLAGRLLHTPLFAYRYSRIQNKTET